MLKKICGLFLGLVVCAGSACVTPTHASSAQNSIIITHVQASGEIRARDEYVALYNNSNIEVDVTDWCLVNKNNVEFACYVSQNTLENERYYIPAYGYSVLVSRDAALGGIVDGEYTIMYEVTNQSSGSIVNSGDTLMLLNEMDEISDVVSWDNAIAPDKMLIRVKVMVGPDIYATANPTADWIREARIYPPMDTIVVRSELIDDDNEAGTDTDTETDTDTGTDVGTLLPPIITEILANPAGVDIGNEFIELYNPNDHDEILLDGWVLLVGLDTVKSYPLPAGMTILPKGYIILTNQAMGYTLVNTTGRVQLMNGDAAIGEPVDYTLAKDDYAWAYIEGVWRYTKPATPGMANAMLVEVAEEPPSETATNKERKPCASNQFRNPETGRCKLLSSKTPTLTPCKANQERNPETNRCRTIAVATAPKPCKEGQERNPETNRCRNIVKMSSAGFGVAGVQTKNDTTLRWYYWAAIAIIIALILGYAVWEWRQELLALWAKVKAPFAKRTD